MKHFTIYTLSVLLVLAACEREAIPVNKRETPGEGERITLRFEAPVTRSEIDGTTGVMTWTSGDQIAVCCTDGATKRYETVTVNTSASTAEITMGASDSRCDYAVFPASAVPASPTAAQFTAPAVVFPTTYDIQGKNAETYSPCPMVAVNSGSTLDFYHVGALVRIQLTDVPEGTAAIRVTFTGMTHVTGTYNVSGAGTAGATLSLASGTGNTVTVTIDADDEYVNIPIPQGDYSALTGLSVEALDSSNATLNTVNRSVEWNLFTRGRGRTLEMSLAIRMYTFGGLMIAQGNLYWDGHDWSIDETWDQHCTHSIAYGKSNGTASSYFSFIELGTLFESSSFSTSSGAIDNLLDPLDGWRVPTNAESQTIFSSSSPRPGSIVNSTNRNILYTFIYVSDYDVIGTLVFPDGETITGTTLDLDTGLTELTSTQLQSYLDQGCVFFPCIGYYNGGTGSSAGWITMQGDGYYWQTDLILSANGRVIYLGLSNFSINVNGRGLNRSYMYVPVRLVKTASVSQIPNYIKISNLNGDGTVLELSNGFTTSNLSINPPIVYDSNDNIVSGNWPNRTQFVINGGAGYAFNSSTNPTSYTYFTDANGR